MALKKGSQIGPYTVIEPLSRGGMAQVYRVRDKRKRKDLALKVSLDNKRQTTNEVALRQEVDLLKSLDHPGIIKVLPIELRGMKKGQESYMARDLRIPGGPWYYAMEYLPGGSLDTILKQSGFFPNRLSAFIGLRLAKSLRYIHAKGLVHLDIKPHNVLMRYTLTKGALVEPVIIDFGVAAKSKQRDAKGGTLITMPPEYILKNRGQIAPEQRVDLQKVDIYALGVVVYRMWTGKYPFDGISQGSLTSSILHNKVRPPRDINPKIPYHIEQLMLEWLAKDPLARPSLKEIIKELEQVSAGLQRVPDDFIARKSGTRKWWVFKK